MKFLKISNTIFLPKEDKSNLKKNIYLLLILQMISYNGFLISTQKKPITIPIKE